MPNGKENRREVKNTIPRGKKTQKQKLIRNQSRYTCSLKEDWKQEIPNLQFISSFVQNEIQVTSTISKAWCYMHIEYF